MMTDQDVRVKAEEIVAKHGQLAQLYVLSQIADVIDDLGASEEWCRIAAAVDAINDAQSHGAN